MNDDSNFCKFIPQGYKCKVTGTCTDANSGTNTACTNANANTAQTCDEKSIAGGICVFTPGSTVPSEGCDDIEPCVRGTYSTGPLKEHLAGIMNTVNVQTLALSNTCQAIPAGQECDLLNDNTNQSVAYTGDENTRSFALDATGCGSTRNCPRGLFRVANSNDAKCSRIPLGKGCADHKANSLVRGKPSHYSTQNDEDSPGCKTVAACDNGYFRGIGVLDNNGDTLSRYSTPASSSNAEGTAYDTWCTQCPIGHECFDCQGVVVGADMGMDADDILASESDGDDFTWIGSANGASTSSSESNECKSARPCAQGYYKDASKQGQTLCTIIPKGSYCKTPDQATSECKSAGQCGVFGNMAGISITAGSHECTACTDQLPKWVSANNGLYLPFYRSGLYPMQCRILWRWVLCDVKAVRTAGHRVRVRLDASAVCQR